MEAERSSPSRTAGICIRTVTLLGVEYTLSQPDKVKKAAEEEAIVISRRLDMLPAVVQACRVLSPEEQATWVNACMEKFMCGIASPAEWQAYFSSLWQWAYRFWNALDPKHKGSMGLMEGVRWAFEIVANPELTKEEMDALKRAIVQVSQEEATKN